MASAAQSKPDVDEMNSPTTPRANLVQSQHPPGPSSPPARSHVEDLPIDPALRSEPQDQAVANDFPAQAPVTSQESQTLKRTSADFDAMDAMDLDDSDPDQQGSDNDTENEATSSRKKKGQRFFCTGYPPCNLSFTRSEHLARHIRKHTGERPFQCHCNRRFSRLDNLRQHAQTVHVNEDIPTDSLAATGTRFQRQIRTDRVRPTGRPRTNTMGSTGSIGRGHSRNASTSSIGSTSSTFSTSTEPRRRPPPLAMATDASGRPKLGLEPPSTPPPYRGYADHSPGGLSTPTSSTYPATPGSPVYGSSNGSPAFLGSRTPARRLSVPTGNSPFHSPYSNTYPTPYTHHMGPPAQVSASSSIYASPVATSFPQGAGYAAPGDDWRRRTWHATSFYGAPYNYGRPATSGLTYSQTPDAPQPAFAQNATAAAGQAPRLPGIESFDHVQHRPTTPPRRQPSPMQLDQPPPPSAYPAPFPSHQMAYPGGRPGHVSWHAPQTVTYLPPQQHHPPPGTSSTWGQETLREIQSVTARPDLHSQHAGMGPPPSIHGGQHPQQIAQEALQMQPSTPKRSKRQAWYNGPYSATRTSPEDSSSSDGVPTPGTSTAEVHPAIVHSNGYIEPHHAATTEAPAPVSTLALQYELKSNEPQTCAPTSNSIGYPSRNERARSPRFSERRNAPAELSGLDALVAVATSEEKATVIAS